jgi:GST-like protein
LAEKTGQFLPEKTPAARAELLSWMMFIATGIGPYSGQAVHFNHFAPKWRRLRGRSVTARSLRAGSLADDRGAPPRGARSAQALVIGAARSSKCAMLAASVFNPR